MEAGQVIKYSFAMSTNLIANFSNDPAVIVTELLANLSDFRLRITGIPESTKHTSNSDIPKNIRQETDSDIPESIRQEASSEWSSLGVSAQAFSQITNPEEHAKALEEIASYLESFRDKYADFLCQEDIQRFEAYLHAIQVVIDSNEQVKATISALDDLFASWHERFDEQEMSESSFFVADIFGS